jgi:ketosteroid isomerase-like protein
MSQENVEIVRAVYERWERGDFRATLDMLDAHVVLVLGPEFPEAGTYFGIEAVSEYTRGLLEPFTDFTMAAEEVVPAEGSVLVSVHQRGVGSNSGVPTVLRYFTLWTFRGRSAIRIESFRERQAALEAVGLSEQDASADS